MKERINKLRIALDELNLDAIYLTSRVSHRYFAKFDNEDGALLITKNNAYAFEDFRYTEIATKLLDGTYKVIQPKVKRAQWINEVVAEENIKNLGVEDYKITPDKIITFFVGQLMKQTKGKANVVKAKELLNQKLK